VAQNFWDGAPICAINAELGHYEEGPLVPAEVRRRVVVVGGGPGGMEAARVAAIRGHSVTLLEKSPHLGGTARFSSLTTPMNAQFVRYLTTEISRLDVDIRTSTPVTASLLRELNADVVIVATGARRERPDVPGSALPHVFSGDDLRALLTGDDPAAAARLPIHRRLIVSIGRSLGMMSNMDRVRSMSKRWMPIGKRVVVVGGGLVGVELAEYLAERGRSVTVLEAGEKLGLEMAHPRRARAVHEARNHGVEFVTGADLVSITQSDVSYRIGEDARTVRADAVVIASGVHTDHSIAEQLIADGFEVQVVGDAVSVGYIEGAVRTGYLAGRSL
jgi:NADPH-dependent 2,4-dienoyl-CoA reductase/sulfur reductase-like enzyme